jgi:hypothetical protein
MISGQLKRFMYQDQRGPLVTSTRAESHCPPPFVDLYIALHNGTMAKPYVGSFREPPYIRNSSVAMIEEWYRGRGANRVTVKIVGDDHMDEMSRDLMRHVGSVHKLGHNVTDFIHKDPYQLFKSYSRTFYMRHLVYTMALDHPPYQVYVSLREDNYLLSPLELSNIT